MAVTPILGITECSPTQTDKVPTINDMVVALEAGILDWQTVDFTGGSVTVTPTQYTSHAIFVAANASADVTMTVPLTKRWFMVRNPTAHNVTVKGATGTGPTISAGNDALILNDATNCYVLNFQTTGGVTNLTAGAGLTTTKGSTGGSITTTGTLYSIVALNSQTGTTYTVVDGDQAKLLRFSNAAAVAVTLPQAGAGSAFLAGWAAYFKNAGAGTVTITPATSTIGGAASLALKTNQDALVISDGTNYHVFRGMASLATLSDVLLTSAASGDMLRYNGTNWVNYRPSVGFGLNSSSSVLTASQVLAYDKAQVAYTIPANFGSCPDGQQSQCTAAIKPTGAPVLNVDQCPAASDPSVSGNWTNIGTITFGSATFTTTFATVGGTAKSIAQGDIVRVVGPSSADATLASVIGKIMGYR